MVSKRCEGMPSPNNRKSRFNRPVKLKIVGQRINMKVRYVTTKSELVARTSRKNLTGDYGFLDLPHGDTVEKRFNRVRSEQVA